MTLTLLHNKMFDVGDLPVLTFGNCVLKTRVITWPLNLYVRFVVFFSKSKNVTVFFECCTGFLDVGPIRSHKTITVYVVARCEYTCILQHIVCDRHLYRVRDVCRQLNRTKLLADADS